MELWDARAKRWEPMPPPGGEGAAVPMPDGPAQFVARVYAAFAQDVLTGSRLSVSFSDALARRETTEAIRAAAADGKARRIPVAARGGPFTAP